MAEVPLPTPTQVPVPSTDIRNAVFAGAKLDEEVTGIGEFYTDRHGVKRLTNTGRNNQFNAAQQDRESRFNSFIQSSGYEVVGDYTAGPLTITEYNQLVRYKNELWKITADTEIPFATTGNTDESWASSDNLHFVSVGDAALRQNLGSDQYGLGATLINSVYGHLVSEYLYPAPDDFIVGAFFDNSNSKTIYLASSPDGTTFYRLNSNPLAGVNAATTGRDPSLTYFQGYWYIAYTGSQNLGNIGDFTVMRSRDMISWTSYPVKAYGNEVIYKKPGNVIGGNIASIKDVWAPCLWTDGDSLFAGLTVSFNDDTKDRDGATVTWQAPISMRCSDIENMIFDMPKLMFINQDVPRIDIEVTKDASFYYAVVKNEFSKNIELWRSVAPDTGYQQIGEINFGRYVEGASLVYNNAKHLWYVYADAYQLQGSYYYCTSPNLVDWSAAEKISAQFQIRHGSVINLAGNMQAITAIESYKTASSLQHAQGIMQQMKITSVQYLTGDLSIDPVQDRMYAVTGTTDVTLTLPMNYHPHECTVFYVTKMSQAATGGITVSGPMVDGVYKIGYGDSNLNCFAFTLDPSSNKYRCLGISSFDALRSKNNLWSGTNIFNKTLDVFQWSNIGQANTSAGARRLGFYANGDGSVTGYVQSTTNGELAIQGNTGISAANNLYPATTASGFNLGQATNLWNTVYAKNSSINTSDARQKTTPQNMSDVESDAFYEIGQLPWVWQWLSRYQTEGDNARFHAGPTVQAAIEIMTKHGLDWRKYAAFCYDEWEAKDDVYEEWEDEYETLPAQPEIVDNGVVISKAVPEQKILIRPAGRVLISPGWAAGSRYAFRKEELILWIMRAIMNRQIAIESRLSALEKL